jgi:hypothetical protein
MVLDCIDAGYRLPKPRSMPEAIYLKVVRPCWIYHDESKINEKQDPTRSLSIFSGRATFAQIDDDLAAIVATGGAKDSCRRVETTSALCDQSTVHVSPRELDGGDFRFMDGDTGLHSLPNTEDCSAGDSLRVTAGAPVAQTEAYGEYLLCADVEDGARPGLYALTSPANVSPEHDPRETVPATGCAVRDVGPVHVDPRGWYKWRDDVAGNDQLDSPNAQPVAGFSLSNLRESRQSSIVDASECVLTADSKRTASTAALNSDVDTATGRTSDIGQRHESGLSDSDSDKSANQFLDLGNGSATIKTIRASAAAVAFHHQSAGDVSQSGGFRKVVPDSGNPLLDLAAVHAAGYDIYVSPRPCIAGAAAVGNAVIGRR